MNSHPLSSLRLRLHDAYLLPLIVFGSLTYLGLPLSNATVQSLLITVQGFLGTLILQKLLNTDEKSILLVIGPGWVVGSAASFFVFQFVGRGTLGFVATCYLGLTAFFVIQGSCETNERLDRPVWTISQLLGLATLSMSWEFPELLPTAICALALGLLFDVGGQLPKWIFRGSILVLVILAFAPVMLRQDYWWLVTDDYSFFQLLSQHITQSGPFADWGLVNFVRYHWLSYGIGGMLDSLGDPLQPQLTLSLTMPFLYSLSLGSSLILLCQQISARVLSTALLTPVWAVASVTVLDWSGTSTAGVYAVNAAVVVVALTLVQKRPPLRNRILAYLCFVPIVLLTKLGSLFVLLFVTVLLETSFVLSQHRKRLRLTALLLTGVATAAGLLPLLWLLGRISDGFTISPINPALGWPLATGAHYVLLGLIINKLWLIFPLLFVALRIWRYAGPSTSRQVEFLFALIPIAVFGLFLDLSISGKSASFDYGGSSRFQYFSGPMYFVASLGLVGILHFLPRDSGRLSSKVTNGLMIAVMFGAGLAWGRWALGDRLWLLISERVVLLDVSANVWLGFMSRDAKIGSTLLVILASPLVATVRKARSTNWTLLLLCALVGVSVHIGVSESVDSFERSRSEQEIAWAEGVPGSRDVGIWLRENSNSSDLVATNHLIDPSTRVRSTDFSLGYWSQREFYVLGPSFLPVFGEIEEAFELSLRFGIEPSVVDSLSLIRDGVVWFIVDRNISSYSYWFENWNVPYSNERFLVVKLATNHISR